jgi:hypothetical protein
MAERYLNWAHFIGTRGVRIAAIIALGFLIVRLLRALTRRPVRAAKPSRPMTGALHGRQARESRRRVREALAERSSASSVNQCFHLIPQKQGS